MSDPNPWRLDGSGPEIYERYRVPTEFEPLALIFLERVGLKEGERVLDVACGTGIVGRLAVEQVGGLRAVTGVDINPAMLEVARSASRSNGAMEWHTGSAEALPFPDREFDVVLCQQGLQFFDDRQKALSEMFRVLKPGGRLGIAVWQTLQHDPFGLAVADALRRHVSEAAAERAAQALGTEDVLRSLMKGAGFREIVIETVVLTRESESVEQSVRHHLASSGRLAAIAGALSEESRAAVIADVVAALRPYRHPDGWRIPRGTYIAMARRVQSGSV
jgi:SAM-dependent methyltransferase